MKKVLLVLGLFIFLPFLLKAGQWEQIDTLYATNVFQMTWDSSGTSYFAHDGALVETFI